jgi:hypothetical protein
MQSEKQKKCDFSETFSPNSLQIQKKAVPLHRFREERL